MYDYLVTSGSHSPLKFEYMRLSGLGLFSPCITSSLSLTPDQPDAFTSPCSTHVSQSIATPKSHDQRQVMADQVGFHRLFRSLAFILSAEAYASPYIQQRQDDDTLNIPPIFLGSPTSAAMAINPCMAVSVEESG